MSTSAQEEQAERRRVFAQDQSVPRQGTTFHQHAQADADIPRGRFSAIANAQVVGATAVPNYPAASAHQADPCGTEPPLGYRIDELEPLELTTEAQATGDAVVAPSSTTPLVDDVERAASSLSSQPNPTLCQSLRLIAPRELSDVVLGWGFLAIRQGFIFPALQARPAT